MSALTSLSFSCVTGDGTLYSICKPHVMSIPRFGLTVKNTKTDKSVVIHEKI